MNRKISVGMAVSIVILAMTVTFSITMLVAMRLFDSTVSSVKEKESMYNKIAEVDRYVRSNDYYQIDETTLYDRLTAGYLLGTGDKYARYYTASAYTDLMNAQNGTLLGIGVELAVDQSGYAKVTKVYDESPAKEAGITVGCYITAVDGTDVKSLSGVDAIQTRLRGESGTSVNVTWLDSEATEHTVDLTHSGYSTTTVDFQMLQGNVGYIKIRQFDASTPSELDYAIRSLSANNALSLVFDLRDNGGGLLDDALSCIDLVAPEGTLAYAEDQNGTRTVLGSSTGDSYVSLPMVCLVNGNTASAAELFASSLPLALAFVGDAVLELLVRARLVGTTTMGKGTIQSSPQRLSDGSAVVITVAKLICGDGSCFDGTGLSVDVDRPLTADEQTAYYDYTVENDPQIQRAVSTAQQMSGTTTVSGVNEAASSEAASDSTAAEAASSEAAASSETAAESAASSEETASSTAE
jgi:carboxyl-terminal processing protease